MILNRELMQYMISQRGITCLHKVVCFNADVVNIIRKAVLCLCILLIWVLSNDLQELLKRNCDIEIPDGKARSDRLVCET